MPNFKTKLSRAIVINNGAMCRAGVYPKGRGVNPPLLTLQNTCAGLCVETVPTNKAREYTRLRPEQRCITLPANRSEIKPYSVS